MDTLPPELFYRIFGHVLRDSPRSMRAWSCTHKRAWHAGTIDDFVAFWVAENLGPFAAAPFLCHIMDTVVVALLKRVGNRRRAVVALTQSGSREVAETDGAPRLPHGGLYSGGEY